MSSHTQEEESAFAPFTKAERIQQLNDIDKSVSNLLQSAGLALKTLSASQAEPDSPNSADRLNAFKEASNSYFKTLQSVDARMRRQVYGLEEAGIIVEKTRTKSKSDSQDAFGSTASRSSTSGEARVDSSVMDGGTGKLDIGWLNSRSGKVGRSMEAELWAKAKTLLDDLDTEKSQSRDTKRVSGDVDMSG